MIKASLRVAVSLALLLISQHALAVALGEAVLSSDLSSPLCVAVLLSGLAAADIDVAQLQVEVPNHPGQMSVGVLDPLLPQNIKVTLLADERGGATIRITTPTTVRENLPCVLPCA
jgi:hypothetical protein